MTGLAVLEDGAKNGVSIIQKNVPIINNEGRVIGNWRVIPKFAAQTFKNLKLGSSLGGYIVSGATVVNDARNYSQGKFSGAEFTFNTTLTATGDSCRILFFSNLWCFVYFKYIKFI